MKETVNKTFEYLRGDKIIWLVVMVLFTFSMLAVYSASSSLAFKTAEGDASHYLYKQVISALGGILLMYLAHMIDYRYYSRIAQIIWDLSVSRCCFIPCFGVLRSITQVAGSSYRA